MTQYPRVSGDGNFGTVFGPTDIAKAKFQIDICDLPFIGADTNRYWSELASLLDCIDDKLLTFFEANQTKLLGRRNLSRDEVRMLQIRSVRPRYDKETNAVVCHAFNCSSAKYGWDGMGGKVEKKVNVCDHKGQVLPGANVCPGDVVQVTAFANMVYNGVGGDKFGIHWSFEDVAVLMQRSLAQQRTEQPAFVGKRASSLPLISCGTSFSPS